MPSFQIISDLHLEATPSPPIPPLAPTLILAGDIAPLSSPKLIPFLQSMCPSFTQVIYILGNHEYFHLDDPSSALDQIKSTPGLENLHILDRNAVDIDGVRVLGCTLWSRIDGAERQAQIAARVNDFNVIPGWTVAAHNAAHARDLAWLRAQVVAAGETPGHHCRKVLIVTHHAPLVRGTSAPEYKDSPLNAAFATDVLANVCKERGGKGVQAWVYGHTHFCADFTRRGVRVVANQRGYFNTPARKVKKEKGFKWPWEKTAAAIEFDPGKVIHI